MLPKYIDREGLGQAVQGLRRINSMSGSLVSYVAGVSKTKSGETLAAWGCCLNSEKGSA